MRVGDGVVCPCEWVKLIWGVSVFSDLLIKFGECFDMKFRARSDTVIQRTAGASVQFQSTLLCKE